jgi:hypothetical protein
VKAGFLIAGWLIFSLGSFWMFEGKYLIPVKAATASKSPVASKGKVTLTLAWGADCACSQDEVDHLRALTQRYSKSGLELKVLIPCEPQDAARALTAWNATGVPGKAQADPKGANCKQLGLTATPTVIVQDRQGRIVYRGSLHAGRFCHDSSLAFAEQAVEASLVGRTPTVKSVPYYGCAISF